MHRQCCVCRMPAAEAGMDVTHGYHRLCFIAFYEGDEDMVALLPDLDHSGGWVEEEDDMSTQLKAIS